MVAAKYLGFCGQISCCKTVVCTGLCILQVALVDVLRSLGIEPDGIVGHSVGELGCAYADGGLTAEETVLAAYWRGRCVVDGNLPPGGMAAVGEMQAWFRIIASLPQLLFHSVCESLEGFLIENMTRDLSEAWPSQGFLVVCGTSRHVTRVIWSA